MIGAGRFIDEVEDPLDPSPTEVVECTETYSPPWLALGLRDRIHHLDGIPLDNGPVEWIEVPDYLYWYPPTEEWLDEYEYKFRRRHSYYVRTNDGGWTRVY